MAVYAVCRVLKFQLVLKAVCLFDKYQREIFIPVSPSRNVRPAYAEALSVTAVALLHYIVSARSCVKKMLLNIDP